MNSREEAILGIDMAKATFDACFKGPRGLCQRHFQNTECDFAELDSWLKEHHKAGTVRVGIEATGPYWVALAHHLHRNGVTVHLLNPAYVKAHAQALGSRSKTDRVDARVIADYVAKHDCEPWQPLPAELEELRELVRLYADVTQLAASMSQREEGLRSDTARKLQQEVTTVLQGYAEKIFKTAEAHTAQHASLREPVACLKSIKGIGKVTALVLAAELPRGRAARSVAGWAGVTPRHFESGHSVYKRPKLCKQGSNYVRRSLYWPAITALRYNPAMQAFARRLQEAGLGKMQIIGAAMHKLLRWAVGVMKSGKPFDISQHAT